MSSGVTATVLWLLLIVAVLIGSWVQLTANRLNRLHVRTDAAWAALDAALARRAVAVRAAAAALDEDLAASRCLRAAADRAEHAERSVREPAENELSRLLADLDPSLLSSVLAAEIADAEQRVMLARRVHNDAVRDTLALRQRRAVRWLRLAGTAPLPEYFEIAERQLMSYGFAPTRARLTARVLLVDHADRVLLFTAGDSARPEPFWFTVGGTVEPGEQLAAAALRELREEAGLRLLPSALIGPVWRRQVNPALHGVAHDAEEWFFLARVDGVVSGADPSGVADLVAGSAHGHRWWTAEELRASVETVYPEQLADLLPDLLARPWDGTVQLVR